MILPLLLICLVHIKEYLYNPDIKKKLQGLTQWYRKLISQIIYQLSTTPLALNIGRKNYDLQYIQLNNNHLTKSNCYQALHVFACSEQTSQQTFQSMSPAQKEETLEQLKSEYREILIDYFISDQTLKVKIDKFINTLFYANIPVLQIIEMHMELIDEFSKQLKLEGRSDETLLDYRLTLIDILANLCEAYRSSISKIN